MNLYCFFLDTYFIIRIQLQHIIIHFNFYCVNEYAVFTI